VNRPHRLARDPATTRAGYSTRVCAGNRQRGVRPGAVALAVGVALAMAAVGRAQRADYEVVVYGGSSAGVIAAVQAAQMGKSTVLIVRGQHVGGMTASGLGSTDIGNPDTVGGLARAFYSYLGVYYSVTKPLREPTSARVAPLPPSNGGGVDSPAQFDFEPHVAEAVFRMMLDNAGAKCIYGEALKRTSGAGISGRRIEYLETKSGRRFYGRVFIDATYEGDLMAAAGVSYRVGREGQRDYGESLAGVHRNFEWYAEADPYRQRGDPASGLLSGIANVNPGAEGAGDRRVQQYNFRLCLSNVPANRIALVPPAGYDRERYEVLARLLQRDPFPRLASVCKIQPLPNGKADLNANGSFSTDMPGDESSRWPEASDEERVAIVNTYRNYTQGLLWFLANDPAVPASVRAEAAQWGLARDEFTDSGNWPWQLYVREARRMIGAYVITQHDCDRLITAPDCIALGSYAMDSHKVTLFVDESGTLNTEGFFYRSVDPYPISYRAITPRRAQCSNLLVPVCLSATHVAFNSIRMEPVYMMLGQAAGAAACLAIQDGVDVQGLNYSELAAQLKVDGQILTWPGLPDMRGNFAEASEPNDDPLGDPHRRLPLTN
jgi:hypothetical protein